MEYVQQGKTAAFEELYNRYSKRLLHYFLRMLNGHEEKAQDFLQDTFIKIIEKPGLFGTGYRFKPWIFTIAHNLCKNEYRKHQVRNNLETWVDPDCSPSITDDSYSKMETHMDNHTFTNALLAEINKFEPFHRHVFLLRFQENFSIREIGEMMGCPEGTVKSRLFYTIKRLVIKLKDYDPQNSKV